MKVSQEITWFTIPELLEGKAPNNLYEFLSRAHAVYQLKAGNTPIHELPKGTEKE